MFNPIKHYEDGKNKAEYTLTTRNIILNYQIGNIFSYPGSGVTIYDLTDNNNNATIYGGVSYEILNDKKVLTTNGTDGFILSPTATSKSDTDSFSITGWCTPGGIGGGSLFNRGNDGAGGWSMQLDLNSHSIRFGICFNTGGTYNAFPAVTVQANKLYHIAGIYNRTEGKYRIYLNSILVSENVLPANGTLRSSSRGFIIGLTNPSGYYREGSVSEVQFYNTALTEKEIKNNYLFGIKTYNY